jgi:hypothetical protein
MARSTAADSSTRSKSKAGRTRRCSGRRGTIGFWDFIASVAPAAAELCRSAREGVGLLWRSVLPLLRLSFAGYTDRAVNAVSAAWQAADAAGYPAVALDHLRAGLADPCGRWPQSAKSRGRCRRLSPEVLGVLAAGQAEARRAGRPYVTHEDLSVAFAARTGVVAEPGAAADGGGM